MVLATGELKTEVIEDAAHYGYLNQIKRISDRVYVCGYNGQVYRRDDSGWKHMDNGLLESPAAKSLLNIVSIDGTSDHDIYVVGIKGTVAHYDGTLWKRIEAPTRLFLTWVRCLPSGEVYVCGFKGTLLKYSAGQWQVLSDPAFRDDFSCIEFFQGKVYLASLTQVFVLEGDKLKPIDLSSTTPEPDAFRLDAKDDVLWSFGQRYVCFFDGKRWTHVTHPDNG